MSRLRRLFEGTGLFGAAAVLLAALAVAMLIATWASPSSVIWTGRAVAATETDGTVTYYAGGSRYSLDDPGSTRSGPRTVYYDPSNPARGFIYTTADRVFDVAVVGAPAAAAAGMVAAGLLRRRAWRARHRRAVSSGRLYGEGIDSDVMATLLQRHRQTGGP